MTVATIAEQVGEMERRAAQEPADPRMEAFGREQADLRAAGLPAGVAEAGATIPDARLLDVEGAPRSLSQALSDPLAVLVLYRGAWCPYCNIALRTYQQALLPQLVARGVPLIAVSPQKPDGSLTMREKHELEFEVLSDPGNAIAGALGVLTAPSVDSRQAQLDLGLDLDAVNADGTPGIPMPTTAIVDPDRTVRWIDVHPDYSTRSEPEEIIDALDRLEAAGVSIGGN